MPVIAKGDRQLALPKQKKEQEADDSADQMQPVHGRHQQIAAKKVVLQKRRTQLMPLDYQQRKVGHRSEK